MIKRKHLFLLISLAIIMALAAACGGAATEEPAAPAPATEAPAATEVPAEPTEAPVVESFECDDAISCVDIAEGEPVHIAYMLTTSGATSFLGDDSLGGIEIAVEERGQIAGRDILLTGEDSLCNAEGGQTAAVRVVADPTVIGIIGTNCSGAAQSALPTISEAGLVMISPSNTSPSLTDPDQTWLPGYFRTAHNDLFQGRMAAEFAYNELGARTAAAIHDGDPYTEGLARVFADSFADLGGTVTEFAAVNKDDTDMRPVLTSIAADSPDVLYFPIFEPAGNFVAAQSVEVSGLENTTLMGADGLLVQSFGPNTGAAAEGMYLTGPFISSDAYDAFLTKYEAATGGPPPAGFAAHAYDATNIILDAIEAVAVVDSEGTLHIGRQALRDAVTATSNFDGLTGNLTCGETGDCATGEALAVYQLSADQVASEDNWPASIVWTPSGGMVADAGAAVDSDLMVVSAECVNNKIQEIAAVDALTVQFTMCSPDPAFLAKAAFTPFGIQPSEWIAETGGTGEILEHPIGTGPWMLDSWNRGDSVVFKRFDDYWGDAAPFDTLIFRWATEGAARLLELQSGTVDQITNLSPDDFETVQNDPNLTFIPVANPNVLYLAMTNTFEPFDNPDVRKAIAMGVDRQRVVDFFFPQGSEVASHFTPCSIPNGCQGEEWYEFDPEAARALLADAGYPDGFETSIFYRDVFRGYLPEPGVVAVEFQTQLQENLGITADVVVMESGQFIDESTNGRLDGFYLLGWGADYPHVTNFLDFHFSRSNPQYGDPYPEIYEILEAASVIADEAEAAPLYEQANNAIKGLVPMVPIAHGASASAALATVDNAHFRPFGAPLFHRTDPGKDTFIFMQNAEPISLYCTDETDGESLAPCQQVVEPLLGYAIDSGNVEPRVATSCEANDDSTVWTCKIREGVKFHDGSDLDANDVVASWAAGMDASNPYHVGNTGAFEYPSYLFGLMNE